MTPQLDLFYLLFTSDRIDNFIVRRTAKYVKMNITTYAQYGLSKASSPIRNHDSKVITKTPVFKDIPQPNMILEAPECGTSGSNLLNHHSCLAKDGKGNFPDLHCSASASGDVKEHIIICDNPDRRLPVSSCITVSSMVFHHP